MTSQKTSSAQNVMRGIGLASLGYGFFSVQDATVKWLVAGYAVPQILFTRSLVIVLLAGLIGGRRNLTALASSQNKAALTARAALILLAWLSYYSAARFLGLAQLTTIYFAAPMIVVVLSVLILKEALVLSRCLVVFVGFIGVLLAANPGGSVDIIPAGMALFAACCWGLSVILARVINRSETTTAQMIVSNALFAAVCAIMLVWSWKTPDPFSLSLMLGLGIAGGLGQFFLYEGYRFAPASALAPIEYSGLVWAFIYGYVIWADIPRFQVFAGASLVVSSCFALIWLERRRQPAHEQIIG